MRSALGEWLQVREAADWAARSEALVARVLTGTPSAGGLRVLDLASGAGSNVRYLAPRLAVRQHWRVVDRDAALLAAARVHLAAWASANGVAFRGDAAGCHLHGPVSEWTIEMCRRDLGSLDDMLFDGRDLVTASALLDLTADVWIRDLASRCRAAGATVLMALTYDGRVSCEPADADDEMVRDLFNRHQRTDKGLGGLAAGPGAHEAAVRAFTDVGYTVAAEPTDWRLDAGARTLQRPLIDGWAHAAIEMAPERVETIERWRQRRLDHVEAGRSRLVVGHHDLAAWLPSTGV